MDGVSSWEPYQDKDTQGTPVFIFLDVSLRANTNATTLEEQRKNKKINDGVTFTHVGKCEEYISKKTKNRLVLVASGRSGQTLVPRIHQWSQVTSIYIFCMDKASHDKWACNFSKVKAVTTCSEDLLSRIMREVQPIGTDITSQKPRMQAGEPLTYDTFNINNRTGSSTMNINGKFIYFQLLIDCLMRLDANANNHCELISICKKEYRTIRAQPEHIRQFTNYSPDKALWWYTRESFFYRVLNEALRVQDIHMLFLFRSFIVDIYHRMKELNESQSRSHFCVYRGQLMSHNELQHLEKHIGQFISINSFLSTTSQRSMALFFLGDGTPDNHRQKVLFEIDINSNQIKSNSSKPFADITEISDFPSEGEVLFMLGSIFHLISIQQNHENIWVIRMSLCSDDEHDLREVYQDMKQKNGRGPTNLRTLSKLLWSMGQLTLAGKYLGQLIDELPSNEFWQSVVYHDLQEINSQNRQWDMSMRWAKKLHEINQQAATMDNHGDVEGKRKIAASSKKPQQTSPRELACPVCHRSGRLANPFRLPTGFRVVLYDHIPFYEDRHSYEQILRDVTALDKRTASRIECLTEGHVRDAFFRDFSSLPRDIYLVYREGAVDLYNCYRYQNDLSDIFLGKHSRFCFFRWKNSKDLWEVFVCCHTHV